MYAAYGSWNFTYGGTGMSNYEKDVKLLSEKIGAEVLSANCWQASELQKSTNEIQSWAKSNLNKIEKKL